MMRSHQWCVMQPTMEINYLNFKNPKCIKTQGVFKKFTM